MNNVTVSLRPEFGSRARSKELLLKLQHRGINLAELHTASKKGKGSENYRNDFIYPAMDRNVLICKNFFQNVFTDICVNPAVCMNLFFIFTLSPRNIHKLFVFKI